MKTACLSALLVALALAAASVGFGYAFAPHPPEWILSPDERAARAKSLWEAARRYEQEENWPKAARRFRLCEENFPESPFAVESLFRLGTCLEKMERPLDAFYAYQKILDNYPRQGDLETILGRQFAIGEFYLNQRRDYLLYTTRPGLASAAEIFRQIVRTATFSDYSPRAQFNLAQALQAQGKYDEAELEYDLVKQNYPDSPSMPDALYQLGLCAQERALGSAYDNYEVKRATDAFREFVRRFPQAPQVPQAKELIKDLLGVEAEKSYSIGRYYERKDCPEGARIYYREVVDKFPGTSYASRAQERLDGLKEAPVSD